MDSDGRRFQILGSSLVASERAHAAAGSSGRAGAGAAHPGGADKLDECIAEEIRALAEGKEEKGE